MTTPNGYWGKAWHGRLLHFWTTNRETLCGKTHMLAHSYRNRFSFATGRCKRCQKKHAALLAEREKGAS